MRMQSPDAAKRIKRNKGMSYSFLLRATGIDFMLFTGGERIKRIPLKGNVKSEYIEIENKDIIERIENNIGEWLIYGKVTKQEYVVIMEQKVTDDKLPLYLKMFRSESKDEMKVINISTKSTGWRYYKGRGTEGK